MESVTRRASKLLGNCRPENICKELKKLKQQDKSQLEAYNITLRSRVADLKVELAMKDEEIRQLQVQTESLEWIWEVVGTPGDVLNKACLFDNDIKTEGQLSTAKIIPILVNFTMKMEAALVDIWKLIFRSSIGESSRLPLPHPKETPQKEKLLEEVKTPHPQWPIKELVAGLAKIEIPQTTIPPATQAAAKAKKTRRDLKTPKTTSFELAS